MKTRTKTAEFAVSLSKHHDGQICRPVLYVRRTGQGGVVYAARWHWVDSGIPAGEPGREYGHGVAGGDYRTVSAAVEAAGIRTDDVRF